MGRGRFTLDTRPFTAVERATLAPDLEALGADAVILDLYDATIAAQSRLTRPRLLRAEYDGRLLGAALVFVCHDSGRAMFSDPRLRRAMHRLPPLWYWERGSVGTDGHAGPGFVASGIDRHSFVGAAVSWLSRRFAVGVLINPTGQGIKTPHLPWPGFGISTLAVTANSRAQLLAAHKNLARKVRKFESRGGTVEAIVGAMPAELGDILVGGYSIERVLDPPFRENYEDMVKRHWALDGDRLVHLVARLDGQPVGYHSFAVSGRRLVLLSGVFQRRDNGTAHAYENVLLSSLDLAIARNCDVVEYGGTVNDVKASLLGRDPTEILFVSRVPGTRSVLSRVLPRSRLAVTSPV